MDGNVVSNRRQRGLPRHRAADLLGQQDDVGRAHRGISTLAPCIVAAIVEGRQPATLTRKRLAKLTNLPVEWADQRQALGFR